MENIARQVPPENQRVTIIRCPKCESGKFVELARYPNDHLDHSHIECKDCGNQYNFWNTSEKQLREAFGINYDIYK